MSHVGFRPWAISGAALCTLAFASPAQADRLDALQRQIDALRDQVAEIEANQVSPKNDDQCVEWKFDPAPQFASCDGKFEANLRGRLQVDAGFVEDDLGNLDVEGTEARRARLGIQGRAWKVIKYKFEADFSDNDVSVEDANIQYAGDALGGVKVLVGQTKIPNSLDELTSSRFTTFAERAAFTDAFALTRLLGIMLSYDGEVNNVGYAIDLGAFRGGFNDDVAQPQEGRTLAGRLATWTRVNDNLFHLGGSVRSRALGDTDSDIDYEQRPFVHITDDEIVETQQILEANDEDLFYGIEGAWRWGGLHVQGEWGQVQVDTSADDFTFNGWYVDAGYFLGGRRTYSKGKFGRPRVDNPVGAGGWGALQIAYRYDTLDLSDGTQQGGELTQHIVALNWWLNRHTLLSFNYANGDVKNQTLGDADIGADANGNNGFDAFNVRAQIDW